MYVGIVAVIVLLLFTIWLIANFFINIVELIINLFILWAVCVRSYAELEKEKKQHYYLAGLLAATLAFLIVKVDIFSSVMHIWMPVLFLLVIFLFAQLFFVFHDFYVKRYKK